MANNNLPVGAAAGPSVQGRGASRGKGEDKAGAAAGGAKGTRPCDVAGGTDSCGSGGHGSADDAETSSVDSDTTTTPLVHHGFLRAYASVRDPLMAEMSRATTAFSPGAPLTCTGHSLGGALATLSAADVRARHPATPVTLVTVGQPRVGNAAWAAAVEALCPTATRIVHDGDAVARCPTGGYIHAGRAVRVNE